jgi:LPS export ABC transporter permease LptG
MILDRMLVKLLFRTLLITLGVLLALAMMMDFFETARHLLSGKGTVVEVMVFLLCKVPDFVVVLLPISLVVATCIAFSLLGRDLELRALAAAGIGPARLARPILLVACGVVLVTVLVAEFVVPPALSKMETLMVEKFGRIDSTWHFFRNHHWYQGEADRLFFVGRRSPDGMTMKIVSLLEMDEDFHVKRRTDMRTAAWTGNQWEGTRVVEREFRQGEMVSMRRSDTRRFDWSEGPDRFRDLRGRPKQKSYAQLSRDIEEMGNRGFPATAYLLERNNRFAYPLLGFCLVLFALPWIAQPSRRRALAGALTESIGLVFIAYFLVTMATSAVSGGLLAAWAGAWMPPAFILLAALSAWALVLRRTFSRSSA